MGCCISTNTSSKHPKTRKISKTTPQNSNISKSPPPMHPLLEEEETVKEVLSETRTIPPNPSPRVQENRQNQCPFIKNAPLLSPDFSRNANVHKDHRNGVVCKKPLMAFGGDDVSEDVSEICSTLCESENVSVSTTVTEKREEKNDEFREQLRQFSPAKRKNASSSGEVKRDKTVCRSPGRISEPSPNRARPGPVSGSGYGRTRDSGESSGRRSRSLVTRMNSGPSKRASCRSPMARKTGKSPGRVGSGSGERIRKVDKEMKDVSDDRWPPTSDDSLENPLVSLECFIFL